jgi:chemotaxis protein CheX
MGTEYLDPFVVETIKTFEVMLGVKPEATGQTSKETTDGTYDVSAIIGISGAGTGGVVISFPEAVACAVASKMLREEITQVSQDVSDAIGELINIIVGNAKRDLVKHGFRNLSVSLPNVVVGKHRTVWRTKDMPCNVVRFFTSEFGPFCIEVNIHRSGPVGELGGR